MPAKIDHDKMLSKPEKKKKTVPPPTALKEEKRSSGFFFSSKNMKFIWPYVRLSWRTILASLFSMMVSTLLILVITFMAKEIMKFQEDTEWRLKRKQPPETILSMCARAIRPHLPRMPMLRSAFMREVATRAMVLLVVVILYHIVSFIGHIFAYRTSRRIYYDMISGCTRTILATPHPERLVAVESSQVTSVTFSASWSTGEFLANVLTEVMPRAFEVVFYLLTLINMDTKMTIRIFGVFALVSVGHTLLRRGMNIFLKDQEALERYIHGIILNASRVVATIFVFQRSEYLEYYVVEKAEKSASMKLHFESITTIIDYVYEAGVTICPIIGLVYSLNEKTSLGEGLDIGMYFILLQQLAHSITSLQVQFQNLSTLFPSIIELRHLMMWLAEPLNCQYAILSPTDPSSPLFAEEQNYRQTGKDTNHHHHHHHNNNENTDQEDSPSSITFVNCEEDISVENVSVAFPIPPAYIARMAKKRLVPGAPLETPIPNWEANAHQITALYGPSGCGKSSSLRLLCGLLKPATGAICTHEHALMLEQQHSMVFGSVAENILLERIANHSESATKEEKMQFQLQKEVLEDAMKKAGCDGFVKDPFNYFIDNADNPPFSGGQQQRLRLARVFADGHRCSLVLFDEPTTGLDDVSVELVLASIKELRDVHNKTVIVATHDPRVAAISDQVIKLGDTE